MTQDERRVYLIRAKITPAFNLPCDSVLHTVGPIVGRWLTAKDKELLASCYRACLELAEQSGIKSIAFCCISTGEFHFPNDQAAEIAVHTVREYREQTHSEIEVIFNVLRTSTCKSIETCCDKINRLKNELETADAIVI